MVERARAREREAARRLAIVRLNARVGEAPRLDRELVGLSVVTVPPRRLTHWHRGMRNECLLPDRHHNFEHLRPVRQQNIVLAASCPKDIQNEHGAPTAQKHF